MPINAYTGLMGSGKSFECVVSVIIPAITNGRRVVTNVDGIDNDAIRAYCHEKFHVPLDQLGQVIHCTNEEVQRVDFFPYGKPVDTFCRPGDIICIDEAWRFWGTDCKLLPEHKIFFREHRHFVDAETKVCCDLVLMIQDIGDLHRILKVVVELSFRTKKIKSLGLNSVYLVEMWESLQTEQGRFESHPSSFIAGIVPCADFCARTQPHGEMPPKDGTPVYHGCHAVAFLGAPAPRHGNPRINLCRTVVLSLGWFD